MVIEQTQGGQARQAAQCIWDAAAQMIICQIYELQKLHLPDLGGQRPREVVSIQLKIYHALIAVAGHSRPPAHITARARRAIGPTGVVGPVRAIGAGVQGYERIKIRVRTG